jgi:DNA-binding response OmpR family regulator
VIGTKTEAGNCAEHTVLVVADDLRVLLLAQAMLTGKGHRVLVARDAENAVQVLKRNSFPVHSVAIRAGMNGYKKVQKWSFRCGAKPWTFRCTVDERSVRLQGLHSGADWESAAFTASSSNETHVTGAMRCQ